VFVQDKRREGDEGEREKGIKEGRWGREVPWRASHVLHETK
jgi:hypothetical protein